MMMVHVLILYSIMIVFMCINDMDNDGVCDEVDNCPEDYNPNQENFDLDDDGDICEGIKLNEFSKSKEVIIKIDVLGRKIKTTSIQEVYILLYNDGTVQKLFTH